MPILERVEAELLEPADLRLRPRLEGEVDECRPSPQRESLSQPVARDRRLRPSRLDEEPLEPVRVEAVALDVELVTGRGRHDRAVAERLAKLGDIRLQHLGRRCRRLTRPEIRDQPVDRDRLAPREPAGSRATHAASPPAAKHDGLRQSASNGPRI